MKKLLSLVFALQLAAFAAAAPPTAGSVEKLLVAMDAQKVALAVQKQLNAAMKSGMEQAFKNQTLSPDAQQIADSLRKKITANIGDDLSWDNLKPIYVQVYTETFTQEEIDGLVAFYQSPAGQAYVAKVPTVMQKTMVIMQQRIGPVMARMQQSIREAQQQAAALQRSKAGAGSASVDPTSLADMDTIVDISHTTVQPMAKFQARPQFPFELRKKGLSGQAIILFVVRIDGTVSNLEVVSATDPQFGDAALAAVSKWLFRPAQVDGKPVNCRMEVPIVFTLNQNS